jgi:hypothetical protein
LSVRLCRVPAAGARVSAYEAEPVSSEDLDHLRSLALLGRTRLDETTVLDQTDRAFLEGHLRLVDQAMATGNLARVEARDGLALLAAGPRRPEVVGLFLVIRLDFTFHR